MSTTPDPNLSATERALQALVPTAGALNRDRLMYEAGRRASRPSPAWPMATGAFAVLSAFLGMRLATEPAQIPTETVVAVKPAVRIEPSPPVVHETDSRQPNGGLLQLLLHGVPDSLPAEPARVRQIEDWLRGGPSEVSPLIRTGPAKQTELDDLIEPGILRRGRL